MNLCIARRRPVLTLAVAALVAGLSACGGGGGGSAANPAAIEAGNAAVVTREVIEVGLSAGAFGLRS